MQFKYDVPYVSFRKLFYLLDALELKPIYLYNIISPPTLAKLRKNEPVSLSVVARICDHFGVQPGDIMEVRRKTKCVEVTKNE